MNTLIELYDERAIENILAPDMFRPRRIVYLCPGEVVRDRRRQETLAAFLPITVGSIVSVAIGEVLIALRGKKTRG